VEDRVKTNSVLSHNRLFHFLFLLEFSFSISAILHSKSLQIKEEKTRDPAKKETLGNWISERRFEPMLDTVGRF